MKEIATPPAVEVPAELNITDLLERQFTADPQNILFGRQLSPGQWTDVSTAEFRDQVIALAKGIIGSGIEVGDRVGIMSPTRYEWSLLDFALWYAGAVSVPVYETSSASQIAWIAEDSGLSLVFAETPAHQIVEAVAGGADRARRSAHRVQRPEQLREGRGVSTRTWRSAGPPPSARISPRSSTPREPPVGPKAAS